MLRNPSLALVSNSINNPQSHHGHPDPFPPSPELSGHCFQGKTLVPAHTQALPCGATLSALSDLQLQQGLLSQPSSLSFSPLRAPPASLPTSKLPQPLS